MSLTTNVDIDDFLPEVLPFVRNCPDIAARAAIRNSIIEFCKESTWLRADDDSQTIVVGTSDYTMDIPPYYQVASVVSVNIGGQVVQPKAPDELIKLLGGDWATRSGGAVYYVLREPDIIKLVMKPDTTYNDSLTYVVAVMPKRDSTKVDRQIFDRWAEVISYGARARLYDTPAQPYSDPNQAVKFRQWFLDGVGEAKIEANKGRTRAEMYVRPREIL